MKMNSTTAGQYSFALAPTTDIPRSTFRRNSGWKGTCDAGYLIPMLCDEVYPGDTFNHKTTMFGRMATMQKPIMDNVFIDSFFFFVPNRLVWSNWEKFCGAQDDPGDSTDYEYPLMDIPVGGFTEQSLADYFGLPTKEDYDPVVSLPFRGYNLIFNEWFRDENLMDSLVVGMGDANDTPTDYVLRRTCKRPDYFSAALPWPQKGDDVYLPVAGSAPISYAGDTDGDNLAVLDSNDDERYMRVTGGVIVELGTTGPSANDVLFADLTNTSTTINQFRESMALQRMFELDARGGTRYTEIVRNHFRVISPDARLQRTEFLGGGSTPINVHPVNQTSNDGTNGAVGDLSAYGDFVSRNNRYVKSFTEHGYVIGLYRIRADLNYQQGINKMWLRTDRNSIYWPSFAHLGEQTILSKEIFANGNAEDDDIFGYQERFAELRYRPSIVTGAFRSNATTSLDVYHLAQDFGGRPLLNQSFIEENPPIDRVVEVPSEPNFLLDIFHETTAARPMPQYSIPGNMGRF